MFKNIDMIIKGNVITVANQQPRAEAIGVKGEKIVYVGSMSEVKKGASKDTEIFDLTGKTILPGFIDTHTHPLSTRKIELGVDLSSVKTISETLDKIRQRVTKTSVGKLIFCPDFNRQKVAENRYPTKKELDEVSIKHPIWIQHYDGHYHQVNSLALKMLGFTAGMEGVETDTKGELTGLIQDPASARPLDNGDLYPNETEALEALLHVTREAVSVGITTLFAKECLENAEFIMKNLRRIPVHVHPMVMIRPSDEEINKVLNSKYLGGHVCVCSITDGSVEGRTAALYEPYSDDPTTLGMLYYKDDQLYELIEKLHKAECQISIHCESDRAIDQALWVYEKVLGKYPRKDHRHRIEHFEVSTPKQIRRVARLGVALAMQPMFITVCEGPNLDYYRTLLGEERVKRGHVFRSILNEEILVAGGSDTPMTKMNPLGGISALINHPLNEQRIDMHEAIEIFTINGAKMGFEEDIKGSIEPGKLADFVVLSQDPYRVPKENLRDIKVEMTIVGGKVVYKKSL